MRFSFLLFGQKLRDFIDSFGFKKKKNFEKNVGTLGNVPGGRELLRRLFCPLDSFGHEIVDHYQSAVSFKQPARQHGHLNNRREWCCVSDNTQKKRRAKQKEKMHEQREMAATHARHTHTSRQFRYFRPLATERPACN